jgi:CDP-diacylglycerol--glycerol-3-phosphate 3-phosphatidyltransferase
MNKREIFTIPNYLSFYRLCAFPFILYFALSKHESLFAIFLVINLVTDIADGFIARRFNMETELGARLDAFADNFTYALAIEGIYVFKLEEFLPHKISFLIFIGFLILPILLSLIKFEKFSSFHLYNNKIAGYIEGIFFICLFTIGFITPIYYLMIAWGILGATESIIIQFIIPEQQSNVKGLYWVLKDKKAKKPQSL